VSTPLRDLLHPDELLANAVSACVAKGHRILIVGTRAGNLPSWVSDEPRIVLWPSEGPEIDRATSLPGAVGVVLFFKWVGHRNHRRLIDLARDANVFVHPELLGTGEVRRLLQPLQPKTLETPEAAPKWDGSLYTFVEQHYAYSPARGHQKAEGERLLQLAAQHGLTTTLASVTNTVGTVHRRVERERQAKYLDTPQVASLPASSFTEAERAELAPTPSVAALVAAGATTAVAVDTSLAELLRLLDDAVAVLGLAREQLVNLSGQNTRLRASHAALRDRVLGLFEGI
jgi:hypothetical protein